MIVYKSFETERLILKPTDESDAEFLVELMNTPKWLKNIGDRNIRMVEDAKIYIRSKIMFQFETLGFSNYTVVRKADGAKLGCCGLYNRDWLENIDIGFAFLPQFEKKGFAYEAASKLRDVAIKYFYIHRLCAVTTKENADSQRLLEKLGLKVAEIVKMPNVEEALLLYRLP